MHKTNAETKAFFETMDALVTDRADFGVAVPFTDLYTAKTLSNALLVAAQNVHQAPQGAFTGEISCQMLDEIGVKWVVVGHSERRQYFNETDEAIHEKIKALVSHHMTPILCVGETLEAFEAGDTEKVVRHQVAAALKDLSGDDVKHFVIAYEPVWAIGTGKSATTQIAQETCALVRDEVRRLFGDAVAASVRIQYGGSVKPDNIREYLDQEDIDGALIGGASLEVESFKAIIDAI